MRGMGAEVEVEEEPEVSWVTSVRTQSYVSATGYRIRQQTNSYASIAIMG